LVQLIPGSDQAQSLNSEWANSLSHGVGLLACLAGAPFLVAGALARGGTADLVGASVFALAACIVYAASVIYHGLPPGRPKQFFQVVDHCAIFLLIAGTYTPFTLGILQGGWRWGLLVAVWSLALTGILFKIFFGVGHERISTGFYLATGWVGIVALGPLWAALSGPGLFWLFSGGLTYTVGVVFFTAEQIPFNHLVWHIFVMAGTACHFIAVLRYAH
jgi:hemolysin III